MAVDEQLLDVVAGQVAFQRAKPEQRVEDRLGGPLPLWLVQGGVTGQDVVAVGLGQPLADHRPHQRPVILRRREQPRRAEPAGKLGRCCALHPGDQLLGEGGW
jgi:hypothetical protein